LTKIVLTIQIEDPSLTEHSTHTTSVSHEILNIIGWACSKRGFVWGFLCHCH
jgi:hypothetical protein